VTLIISIFGVGGRIAGDLLTSALGWASSLLFGRVPRSHQVYLVTMMALSFVWLLLALGLLVPSIASFLAPTTPRPPFVDDRWVGYVLLYGVLFLPLLVGLFGHLVPAEGQRPGGLAMVRDVLRGYPLTPLISGLLIFLAGVGIVRKLRSRAHGWSDIHVPIVGEPDGYDRVVKDLEDVLDTAGLAPTAGNAPWVLTMPARLLTAVSGENVRKLRADRLIELRARNLRIGVYPSDIAISGKTRDRTRARAAILSRLAASAVHLTTSAEAQKVEDQIAKLAASNGSRTAHGDGKFDAIDAKLLELAVPTDEWDILYRLRLQAERDDLIGAKPGTEFPGHAATQDR
jgi:hypothetical protein